jgi:hypothetical protein
LETPFESACPFAVRGILAAVTAAAAVADHMLAFRIPVVAAVGIETLQIHPQNSVLKGRGEVDQIHYQIHPAAQKWLDQASCPCLQTSYLESLGIGLSSLAIQAALQSSSAIRKSNWIKYAHDFSWIIFIAEIGLLGTICRPCEFIKSVVEVIRDIRACCQP